VLILLLFMVAGFYQKPGFLFDELYSRSVWLKDTAMLFPLRISCHVFKLHIQGGLDGPPHKTPNCLLTFYLNAQQLTRFCISPRVRDGEKSLHRSPLLLTVTHRFTWAIFFLPVAGLWGIFFSPAPGYSVSAGRILNRKANSRSSSL